MANTKELWEIYDFEQDMFMQTLRLATGECNKFPHPIPHAIVESMLLHLRILVDILLSRGGRDDDIRLTELLPDFKSPLIEQLNTTYGGSNDADSPYWNLNKRLAHATKVRSSPYNYNYLTQPLLPIVLPLLNKVEEARPVSTLKKGEQ